MGPGSHLGSWVYPGARARSRMPRHDSRTPLRHRLRSARPAPRDRLRRHRDRHRRRRERAPDQHLRADRHPPDGRHSTPRPSTAPTAPTTRPPCSGPTASPASSATSCYPKSAIGNVSRYVDYKGNGNYAVVVQTFTNSACTAGAKEQRFLYSIGAGTAITPPDGIVLTRQPNSFSTIIYKVPVALNPGGLSYEVKYARGGVIGPDGGISGPSARRVPGPQHRPRRRPLHRARQLRDGRPHQGGGDYYTPWSAPINFRVKAPFDLSYVGFPDQSGPSYKLRAILRDAVRPRQARDRLLRQGQEGRQVPQARPQLEDQLQAGASRCASRCAGPAPTACSTASRATHWCSAARSPSASGSAADPLR